MKNTIQKSAVLFIIAFMFYLSGCSTINDNKEFYSLQLSYARGGHLGNAKVVVKINGKTPDFFGKDYSAVSQYSGTDMSYINKLIKDGENTINLEILPPESVSEEMKTVPFIFHMSIEHAVKGEMIDSNAEGDIFNYEIRVEPGQPAPKWEKTFKIIKTKK